MALKVYNTLSRIKENFIPLSPLQVNIYACGITVYSDCHIGHARQAITYDMVTTYLRYKGFSVKYVRNYTDVDDKIIMKANELNINALKYSNERILEAEKDMRALKVKDADVKVKASETIPQIIEFIEKLINKKHAYVSDKGDVYFSVRSFKGYGKLSNRKLDDLISGVRKEVEDGKKDPLDFALWKSTKKDEIFWSSPWGNGRPGWHIECSAMCLDNMGTTVDIHGGGVDLIFPHHENEIAQSEALTEKPLAKYWIHNGLITINGQKMSKSLNNVITIKQIINKYHHEVVKFMMLSVHYRNGIDITDDKFEQAEKQLYYFYSTLNRIDKFLSNENTSSYGVTHNNIKDFFENAMDDDFNTSLAISNIFDKIKHVNNLLSKKNSDITDELYSFKKDIVHYYSLLGILQEKPEKFIADIKMKYLLILGLTQQHIEMVLKERTVAKYSKNYADADRLRQDLENCGIIISDTKDGTDWDIKQLYEFE